MPDYDLKTESTPPKSKPLRLIGGMWRQAKRSPVCPDSPRLDGRLALVTGGNGGIGRETSLGLARRGAEVIIAARNRATGEATCDDIRKQSLPPAHYLPLDLSDLASVAAAAEEILPRFPNRKVDLLVENAGIWPKDRSESPQGHEIAFATNTLGHFALTQCLLKRGALDPSGHVIVLTGDIYVLHDECSSDYPYSGARGGQAAYCRSKLGNLWFARELQRRNPELRINVVHPGVVASGLAVAETGFVAAIQKALMISNEAGAQTTLICATQPGVVNAGYYHNTLGLVKLDPSDPAEDPAKASRLWAHMEELAAAYV